MRRTRILTLQSIAAAVIFVTAGVVFGAGGQSVSVSAVILSNSICRFDNPPTALNFGTLDPANSSDVTVITTTQFRCAGNAPIAAYAITDDDGLYETAANANRMQHATNPAAYLPYTFSYNPVSGTTPKNVWTTLTITGTVTAVAYQPALVGAYTDTVVLSIVP
jgi:hypothetical protein